MNTSHTPSAQRKLDHAITLARMTDDCLGRIAQRANRCERRLKASRALVAHRLKYEAERHAAGNPVRVKGPKVLGNQIPIEHQHAAARRRAGLTPERRSQTLKAKRRNAA